MERLQKIIAQAGICSRRKAEELITQGRVSVNGKVITELGFKADISDKITVDNKPIFKKEKLVYLVLNKPRNTVATVKDDRGRKTVIDCIENVNKRIYPVFKHCKRIECRIIHSAFDMWKGRLLIRESNLVCEIRFFGNIKNARCTY